MIWAVILAAGESRRMGQPKLLLPYGEKTIIQTVVSSVVSSKVDGTLVVLGSEREKIKEKIKNFPVRSVYNPDFQKGMLSSVLCGIKALPEETRAMVIVLGDQPSVLKQTIDRIIDEYQKTEKGIVLPVYNKERGHPVLIDLKYRKEVESLSLDVGLRGTVYSHPDDILEVDVDTPSIFQDIDDEADYKRELEFKQKVRS